VPNLTRGGPPPVDLAQLERELRAFLQQATAGDFLARNAPAEARRLMDVAFSGNGEPTSADEFAAAVALVEKVLQDFALLDQLKVRLITNGSLLHRASVREGIARIGAMNGEVWFKVDRASAEGVARVNGIRLTPARIRTALLDCAELAPTWVQTCYFAIDGAETSEDEQLTYLAFIEAVKLKIRGVHLYGLARPSLQPGAEHLAKLPQQSLQRFADRISALRVEVVLNP
jgi:wyosine [tRNA(Phe)-imidazoG37] synthetase (radical SAM superfamily)